MSPAPGVSGGPTACSTDHEGTLRVEWIRIDPNPLHPCTVHVRGPSTLWPLREGSSASSVLKPKTHEMAIVESAPSRRRKKASRIRSRRGVRLRKCKDAGGGAGRRAREVVSIMLRLHDCRVSFIILDLGEAGRILLRPCWADLRRKCDGVTGWNCRASAGRQDDDL